MIIYFAGVPAGNQYIREHHLKRMSVQHRLATFYYQKQTEITLAHYKGEGKVVHCKREHFDVFIGRMATSMHHYGNPFEVGPHGNARQCVEKFRRWLTTDSYPGLEPERKKWILDHVGKLKGKTLGCFCKVPPCHGHVLLELAEAK